MILRGLRSRHANVPDREHSIPAAAVFKEIHGPMGRPAHGITSARHRHTGSGDHILARYSPKPSVIKFTIFASRGQKLSDGALVPSFYETGDYTLGVGEYGQGVLINSSCTLDPRERSLYGGKKT